MSPNPGSSPPWVQWIAAGVSWGWPSPAGASAKTKTRKEINGPNTNITCQVRWNEDPLPLQAAPCSNWLARAQALRQREAPRGRAITAGRTFGLGQAQGQGPTRGQGGANLAKPTSSGTRRTPSLGLGHCQARLLVPADLLLLCVLPAG
jgi:hypothetical protein